MKKLRKSLDWHLCNRKSDYHLAKRTASARFLGIPKRGRRVQSVKIAPELMANLVGVGVAEKRSQRESCGVPAITFYVQRKLPKSRLTRRLLLPRTIDGLACDVVACGGMRPAQGELPFELLDPVTPGAQIQVEGARSGTLGGFVRDADGDLCLVSNCHVLSTDLVTPGAGVFQPGIEFPGSRRIATVKRVVSISADGVNTVDVALAKLEPGIAHDAAIPDLGPITGIGEPSPAARVRKVGQATLETSGRFDSVDTDVTVDYDILSANFTNICVFRPGSFADDGDSGSFIVEEDTGTLVGLLFATSALLNFAIPISAIDTALPGLTWVLPA
jgi:hypothetical protein